MPHPVVRTLEDLAEQTLCQQHHGETAAVTTIHNFIFEIAGFLGPDLQAETDPILAKIITSKTSAADVLHYYGLMHHFRGNHETALAALEMALLIAPERPDLQLTYGNIFVAMGNTGKAQQIFKALQDTSLQAADALFLCEATALMPGEDYYAVLKRFHDWLKPATYIEIGLGHGKSLAFAPPARTLAVDPVMGSYNMLPFTAPTATTELYKMTSDDFFANHDLRVELGTETFDLAFIDGLHHYDQVLRDFINLERYAGPHSVILIHDCLPICPSVANRERQTGFWTGDVWKIIPCLKALRPDLEICIIPTKPSGLAVVTHLDPASTVLPQNYETISTYYGKLSLPENTVEKNLLLKCMPNNWSAISQQLARFTGKPAVSP